MGHGGKAKIWCWLKMIELQKEGLEDWPNLWSLWSPTHRFGLGLFHLLAVHRKEVGGVDSRDGFRSFAFFFAPKKPHIEGCLV